MKETVEIRFADQEGKARFENWCIENGVEAQPKATCVQEAGAILYHLDPQGIYGVYEIDPDDAVLVLMRWRGTLA